MTLKYNDLKLGIVTPLANEKETVEDFVQEVLAVCRSFEFKSIRFYVVLDLSSTDGTLDILKKLSQHNQELKIIFAPDNKNVVDAYKRGYYEAIADSVDWILEMDGGFSHKPQEIPEFFETMIKGDYDCVFGSRFCTNGKIKKGSLKNILVSWGGTWVANLLLGTKLFDMTSGFELFKREALVQILQKGVLSHGPFFQTEIRTFAHRFKIIEVPIVYNASTGHVHRKAILDAFRNLYRLFLLRLKGELNSL